jgi:hypothetical protein
MKHALFSALVLSAWAASSSAFCADLEVESFTGKFQVLSCTSSTPASAQLSGGNAVTVTASPHGSSGYQDVVVNEDCRGAVCFVTSFSKVNGPAETKFSPNELGLDTRWSKVYSSIRGNVLTGVISDKEGPAVEIPFQKADTQTSTLTIDGDQNAELKIVNTSSSSAGSTLDCQMRRVL